MSLRHARGIARSSALLAVSFLLGLQLVALAPAARADLTATCVRTEHVDAVTANGQVVTVKRSGPDLLVNDSACGTVKPIGGDTTVDTVNIEMNLSGVSNKLVFDLSGGRFAPGFTSEAKGSASSEIEFHVTLDQGVAFPNIPIEVDGGDFRDGIAVGDRTTRPPDNEPVQGLNLDTRQDHRSGVLDEDVTVHGQAGWLVLNGNGGNDVLAAASTGAYHSHPTALSLRVDDGLGADIVIGGTGGDDFTAEATPDPGDSYSGGDGYDVLTYEHRTSGVSLTQDGKRNDGHGCPGPSCEKDNVGSDIERLTGGPGNDRLIGGPGPQYLDGGQGNNTIAGGHGKDLLVAGTGADRFHGGTGFDSLTYEYERIVSAGEPGVNVRLNGLADDGAIGEGDNVGSDIEAVYGSAGNDHLTGDGGRNRLHGYTGDDFLDGLGGDDVLDGGGASFPFPFFSSDGSDVYRGGGGVDTVLPPSFYGALSLSIDNVANDQTVGHPEWGVDNIRTDVENVIGGFSDDDITGSAAANRLVGGTGKDTLRGLRGNDTLVPGAGDDTVIGAHGLDTAVFTEAPAPIVANLEAGSATGDGTDTLAGVERILGSRFGDDLTGSSVANVMTGDRGADVLRGLAGDDTLLGGPGNDTFDGGPGVDVCVQASGHGTRTSCEL